MVSLAAVESLAAGLWPDAQHVALSLPDARKGEQLVLVTDKPGGEQGRAAWRMPARKAFPSSGCRRRCWWWRRSRFSPPARSTCRRPTRWRARPAHSFDLSLLSVCCEAARRLRSHRGAANTQRPRKTSSLTTALDRPPRLFHGCRPLAASRGPAGEAATTSNISRECKRYDHDHDASRVEGGDVVAVRAPTLGWALRRTLLGHRHPYRVRSPPRRACFTPPSILRKRRNRPPCPIRSWKPFGPRPGAAPAHLNRRKPRCAARDTGAAAPAIASLCAQLPGMHLRVRVHRWLGLRPL